MNDSARAQLLRNTFLTNGGTETFLIFELGHSLRENCAFEVFDDDARWDELNRAYLEPIADAAHESGLGLLYDVMVWRASPDWFERLGYGAADVVRLNTRAVERTRASLDGWRAKRSAGDMPILLSADIGPRGDGYRVDAVSASPQAGFDYHREQIGILARAGVHVVQALTMTHVNEAIGIVLAAREYGLPVIVSPTVETDGRAPDGTALGDFIRQVDEATHGVPLHYMVNCAHPSHVLPTLRAARDEKADWLTRFKGFRANASHKSHQELDESSTLDIGDPRALGAQIAGMHQDFGLGVVGGCCGTDARHISEIARHTAASNARPNSSEGRHSTPRISGSRARS